MDNKISIESHCSSKKKKKKKLKENLKKKIKARILKQEIFVRFSKSIKQKANN